MPDGVWHVRPLGEPPRAAELAGEQVDGVRAELLEIVGRPAQHGRAPGRGPAGPYPAVEALPGGRDPASISAAEASTDEPNATPVDGSTGVCSVPPRDGTQRPPTKTSGRVTRSDMAMLP